MHIALFRRRKGILGMFCVLLVVAARSNGTLSTATNGGRRLTSRMKRKQNLSGPSPVQECEASLLGDDLKNFGLIMSRCLSLSRAHWQGFGF